MPAIPLIRRFYFELVGSRLAGGPSPLDVLADPRFVGALTSLKRAAADDVVRIAAAFPLGALVEPLDLRGVIAAHKALAAHGIGLDVWPQLEGALFLNGATARVFQERLLPLVDALECEPDAHGVGLALDVEPKRAHADAAWGAMSGNVLRRGASVAKFAVESVKSALGARQGARDLRELAHDLKARTLPVHAAVLPPLFVDGEALRARFLGCPAVDDDGAPLFETQAAMCYATSLARVSNRYDRERQKQTLALWAARHKLRFDAVVVGQTSTGIFGDEPTYLEPKALAEDVRAMEALGFVDIGVYALEGVLFGATGTPDPDLTLRDDVDAWIAASMGR